jgi:hypothetical protein
LTQDGFQWLFIVNVKMKLKFYIRWLVERLLISQERFVRMELLVL